MLILLFPMRMTGRLSILRLRAEFSRPIRYDVSFHDSGASLIDRAVGFSSLCTELMCYSLFCAQNHWQLTFPRKRSSEIPGMYWFVEMAAEVHISRKLECDAVYPNLPEIQPGDRFRS